MFISGDFISKPLGHMSRLSRFRIYVDHYRSAPGALFILIVYHSLLEDETLVANGETAGGDIYRVAVMDGLYIGAMHVGNHTRRWLRTGRSQAHILHIFGLPKVIKGEIDRVVEMAQNVYVVKS